jgi:predicted acylesterase/phospholipase RssA
LDAWPHNESADVGQDLLLAGKGPPGRVVSKSETLFRRIIMSTQTACAKQADIPQVKSAGRIEARTMRAAGVGGSKIGLAFQGGSFLAGAIATGVVAGLVEKRAFKEYDISAFSGTSAGALAAAVCWRNALEGVGSTSMEERMEKAHRELQEQWLHNANGMVPNQAAGDFMKMLDHLWSSNPLYFWWKDQVSVKWLHGEFEKWVDLYVKPEASIRLLFEQYVQPGDPQAVLDPDAAWRRYCQDDKRPHLVVGATRVVDSENVHITDEDFFSELVEALKRHRGDVDAAIKVAADYMRQGIMASGSIDFMNGMTTIEHGRHEGTYLDGAWSENPPLDGLVDAGVDQIWMVEVFPRECGDLPETFAEREDRREELWQNAVVEQQVDFFKKVNLWVESGMLVSNAADLEKIRIDLRERLKDPESADGKRLLAAFMESDEHWQEYIDEEANTVDVDRLVNRVVRPYRHIGWGCMKLPPEMQRLTAGARIVNDRRFLIDKMAMGRQMAEDFLSR